MGHSDMARRLWGVTGGLGKHRHTCFFFLESQNVDFVCSVLVVADQLLISRLKEICEVALTEKRE